MTDLQALLDQIDRFDGELLPDWKYNDRTGAVIANAYRKQGDKWSCLVAKDIAADCDGEFIALARTALPKLAEAVYHVLELLDVTEKSDKYAYNFGGNKAPSLVTTNEVRRAIIDQLEGEE